LTRRLVAGLAAAFILAAGLGTASARNLSATHQSLRATWAGLELTNSINTVTVRCPVTLEGSFHSRTIAKVANSLTGYITRAVLNSGACTNGRSTLLVETLPWHLTYEGFTGTLPSIATIRFLLIRVAFDIEDGTNVCLMVTTSEEPASGIAVLGVGGVVNGLRVDETRRIRLRNGPGGLFCGLGNGSLRGTGGLTVLGTSNSVSITLI